MTDSILGAKRPNLGPSSGPPLKCVKENMVGNGDDLPTFGPTSDDQVWKPIHFKTTYEDSKLRQRFSLITCLPSGVSDLSSMSAKVQNDGHTLVLKCSIPEAVSNPEKFLGFFKMSKDGASSNEFRERAFHKALSHSKSSRADVMWCRFECPLDFPCIEDIPLVRMIFLDGCFFLFIELFAKEKHQYMEDNGRLSGAIINMSNNY